jgi:hypothetical protein
MLRAVGGSERREAPFQCIACGGELASALQPAGLCHQGIADDATSGVVMPFLTRNAKRMPRQ